MATIKKNITYEIGMLKSGSVKDYPEFLRSKKRSVFGSVMIEQGITTWEEFFTRNPLELSPGIWHVYEIDEVGKQKWITQGEARKSGAIQLGDGHTSERNEGRERSSRTEQLELDLNEQKNINEHLRRQLSDDTKTIRLEFQARIDSLTAENNFLRTENKELKAKEANVFEERLKDKVEIQRLTYDLDKLANEKKQEVETLKDSFAKDDKNMQAISKIIGHYEGQNKEKKSGILADFIKEAFSEIKPHLGGFVEAATEALREKYGKKEGNSDSQVYEG